MAAMIFPGFAGGNYYTAAVSLANTNKTTLYTVGDNGEKSAIMIWCRVTDPASVATAATIHVSLGGTERSLDFDTATNAAPQEVEMPIAMYAGDTVKVTGASGHTCWATFLLEVPGGQQAR